MDARTLEAELDGAVHALEKPLTAGDFASQHEPLRRMSSVLGEAHVAGIGALEERLRGRVFTALLRAGRQTSQVEGADREIARRRVHELLAQIWKALGDEHREAASLAAAGRTGSAVSVLRQAGTWDDIATLYEKENRWAEAARLHEEHGAHADAARCHKAAGDVRSALRCLLRAGDDAAVRPAVREADAGIAEAALLKAGRRDLLAEWMEERGQWTRLAELREGWRDAAGAAAAWEKADRPEKAIAAWRKARRESEALRLIEAEVKPLLDRGDAEDAAFKLAHFGLFERAAGLVAEKRPEHAHRWLSQGGLDEQALALARREARRAQARGRPQDAAAWHEKAGEQALAAELWEKSGHLLKAGTLWEQLSRWDAAALCCEKLGRLDRARELYARTGDAASVARVEAALAVRKGSS